MKLKRTTAGPAQAAYTI